MDICAELDPPAFVSPTGIVSRCHLHTSGPTLAGAPISELVSRAAAS
jgi:oligopeptide transport system ATP-binding protein